MNIPTDLSPQEARDALHRLARTTERLLVECGVPASVAFATASIAASNSCRRARGQAPVLPREIAGGLRAVQ